MGDPKFWAEMGHADSSLFERIEINIKEVAYLICAVTEKEFFPQMDEDFAGVARRWCFEGDERALEILEDVLFRRRRRLWKDVGEAYCQSLWLWREGFAPRDLVERYEETAVCGRMATAACEPR